MRKMIKATIATTIITPVHMPALNIPAMAEQLVKKITDAKNKLIMKTVFHFI
jgi:hypothetical protein